MKTARAKRFGAWWTKPWSDPCAGSTVPLFCHFDLFLPVYCCSAIATFNLKTALLPAWCCPGVLIAHLLSALDPMLADWTSPSLVSLGRLPNVPQLQPCPCIQVASHYKVLYVQGHARIAAWSSGWGSHPCTNSQGSTASLLLHLPPPTNEPLAVRGLQGDTGSGHARDRHIPVSRPLLA